MAQTESAAGLRIPVKPLINPLTEADKAALQQAIAHFEAVEDLLNRAEHCGMPVGPHREKHEAHKEVAKRMMQAFFPDHLPSDVT